VLSQHSHQVRTGYLWLLATAPCTFLYTLHPIHPTPYTTPTPYLHQANVAIKIEGEHVTALSTAQVHQQCPHDSINDSAGTAGAPQADQGGYENVDVEPEMMTGSRIRAESFRAASYPESGL
jgi:hypothetical protein